ncbi:hypothetical protein BDP27DRAFT_1336012 [Rhodocollybia butyracea]|uniref:G domain-containing protein n=1 Tax=Rhodocollybia butyracea TaxID=206335 RepID=A0A9P5PJ00_9AGAR|nr:hypothetical protein BDP27DRAFT_1336012 [Rhodocollybia butyracea]
MSTSIDDPLLSPAFSTGSSSFRPYGSEQDLTSSTDDILKSCNRFRILVLGKSGAGKSSLINATFGVNVANVSHEISGVSDIHTEITFEENSKFILHDSQGFVAGETQNYDTVQKFIMDRAKERELKDRLHAIWFCMEVPTENGALFEKADETFLALDIKSVPVVVVFTKYDLLIRKFEREADDDIGDEELETMVNQKAEEFYNNACVLPLKRITEKRRAPITHVRVSKKPRYSDTLANLAIETQKHLDRHVSVLWQSAQRASVDEKINGCIAVGKRKYWRSLASSLHFPGKTLQQCLYRIHDDVLEVWNFNDPSLHLKSRKFKTMMAFLVDDLHESSPKNRKRSISFNDAYDAVAALPIIPPVALGAAAGLVVVQWIMQVYQEIPSILRLLMGYICDLTSVLQCLFWIMQGEGQSTEVDWPFIGLAMEEYESTGARNTIHAEIWHFVKPNTLFRLKQKAEALDKLDHMLQNAERDEPPEKLDYILEHAQKDEPLEKSNSILDNEEKDEPLEKLDRILQNVRFKAENLGPSPRLSLAFAESDQFAFDVFSF